MQTRWTLTKFLGTLITLRTLIILWTPSAKLPSNPKPAQPEKTAPRKPKRSVLSLLLRFPAEPRAPDLLIHFRELKVQIRELDSADGWVDIAELAVVGAEGAREEVGYRKHAIEIGRE
jgi:hypothetical protein